MDWTLPTSDAVVRSDTNESVSHSMRRVEFQSPQFGFRRIRLKLAAVPSGPQAVSALHVTRPEQKYFIERTIECAFLSPL